MNQTNFIPSSPAGNVASAASGLTQRAADSSNLNFQDILSTMLLTSSMGSESGGGMSAGLLTPLLLTLLEQLIAQEANSSSSAALPWGDEYTAGLTAASDLPVPHNTRLTQDYHDGHHGLDYGVPVGTPIRTSIPGKVTYAGWNNQGYGNLVIVENGPYQTYYAHLSEIPVSVGDTVSTGQVIGLSGNTGNSTGPHLHYEVRVNGQPVNPKTTRL